MRTTEIEEDWITKFNSWSWSSNAKRLFGICSEVLWIERIRIWSLDLANAATNHKQGLALNFANSEYLDEIIAKNILHLSRRDNKYFHGLMNRGDRLVVATSQGNFVFYGFVAFGKKRMYSKYFTLEDGEFFIMRCWTNPKYRGQGIYPQAIGFICKSLAEQGYERGYIDVSTHNIPSIRGIIKVGGKRLDTYYDRLRLLGHDLVFSHGALRSRFID